MNLRRTFILTDREGFEHVYADDEKYDYFYDDYTEPASELVRIHRCGNGRSDEIAVFYKPRYIKVFWGEDDD